jgi:DNA-binding NarL/FixJ family response regulator
LEYDVDEAPTSPIRVVVIDDSEDIRDVLHIALDRADDFEFIASAVDGESGVAIAETHQPDLVLLDIAMPEMDGLQALPVIRQGCPRAVVVMLTGFAEEVAALSAIEQGAHGFIRKGGGVPEILDQVREIWEIRLQGRARAKDI